MSRVSGLSGVPLIEDIVPRRPGVPLTVLKVRATDRCGPSTRTTFTMVFGTSTVPRTASVSGSVTSMPLLFKITKFIPASTPSSAPMLRMSSLRLRMAATFPLMRSLSVPVILAPLGLFNCFRMEDAPVIDRVYVTLFEVAQMDTQLPHGLPQGRSTRIFFLALFSHSSREACSSSQADQARNRSFRETWVGLPNASEGPGGTELSEDGEQCDECLRAGSRRFGLVAQERQEDSKPYPDCREQSAPALARSQSTPPCRHRLLLATLCRTSGSDD